MGDKIDIFKIIMEFLKGNQLFLLLVTSLLGGGFAGYKIPSFFPVPKVEVTVEAPVPDARIDWCVKELKKLKRWHGGE